MLLSSGDVLAGGQIGHNLFAGPTSGKEPCLGVGEAPFKIWNHSVVCRLGAQIIFGDLVVCSSRLRGECQSGRSVDRVHHNRGKE